MFNRSAFNNNTSVYRLSCQNLILCHKANDPMQFLLSLCLLLNVSTLAAQVVAELVYEGLPASVTVEAMNTTARMPTGAEYDKSLTTAERNRITSALVDLGYLDAETMSKVGYIPSGVKLTYIIKARNCYTIAKVEVPGINSEVVSKVLNDLGINSDTPCVASVYQRLALAFAEPMNVNYLFVNATTKKNSDKKTAIVVLSK